MPTAGYRRRSRSAPPRRWRQFGITFLEEPCLPGNAAALVRIARKSPVPIAVGERHYTRWDFSELLDSRTIGVLQPDIIQSGGIAEARKIAALAEMHFVSVAPHNPWSWVNTMASLHLDAVLPNFLMQEVITDPEPWKDAVVVDPPAIDAEGYFAVPSAPGSGHRARPRSGEAVPAGGGAAAGAVARRRRGGGLVDEGSGWVMTGDRTDERGPRPAGRT